MSELYVSSQGTLRIDAQLPTDPQTALPAAGAARIERAFRAGQGAGLAHLATIELQTALTPALAFARRFAQRYIAQLCHLGEPEPEPEPGVGLGTVSPSATRAVAGAPGAPWIAPPNEDELASILLEVPPMRGAEYLQVPQLRAAWLDLDAWIRVEASAGGRGVRAYLHAQNALWNLVGRVTLHLAENKRDEAYPFAFLATYASGVSASGSAQHQPLARALQELAGAGNRRRLLALLTPIREAAERLPWVRELFECGDIYQPLAWTPAQAHRLLRDVQTLEASGLVVRIPDWWTPLAPPRPRVSARVGSQAPASLGADALLDFSVAVTLDGAALTKAEQGELLASASGLVRLRGRWVEVDRERLAAALDHWKRVEREARDGGVSFYEGMRLLAGVAAGAASVVEDAEPLREWSGVEAGEGLRSLLARLREPQHERELVIGTLQARLRPYQDEGVRWLALLTGLGLGACLADDMGLGKTVQVLALLLHLYARPGASGDAGAGAGAGADAGAEAPTLIVAPASLLANWKSELSRFTPTLRYLIAHPSESALDLADGTALERALQGAQGAQVVITSYGMLARTAAMKQRRWRLVVLDEAQAIKNAGSRQARAVKQLASPARIALTGTPVENHLGDLWSLFDFLNPGLLGDARAFARVSRRLTQGQGQHEGQHEGQGGRQGEGRSLAPLRRLVQPYILRRLKTDRRVIADLPDKTEVRAYCGLTREQAALYEQCVRELSRQLGAADGIRRRGIVLAALMQLKQICNHPDQWQGQGGEYLPERSAKFERLGTLCEEMAERQQRALVFTQFRELTEPLAQFLTGVFGRAGLVLHGGTPVGRRRALIDSFQREEGPPFFVLSLKAGGVGLNLTAASQVIHFDRWWNPAVEDQATDRAFRIGQRQNVLVHKFVCRGTVEEKIDAMISAKSAVARELLDEGGEQALTEMDDEALLRIVALDIHKALET